MSVRATLSIKALAVAIALLSTIPVRADAQEATPPLRDFFSGGSLVTEFGFAQKIPNTTSVILLPECHSVLLNEHSFPEDIPEDTPRSCGGDNPTFIGWPIAWDKEFSGPWTIRLGWFHLSHWFDGGPDREVHLDALALYFKFNWTKRNTLSSEDRSNRKPHD